MKERIITGVVLLILFSIPFYLGGPLFSLLTLGLALVGYFEYSRMSKLSIKSFPFLVGILGIILLMAPVFYPGLANFQTSIAALLVLALLSASVFEKNLPVVSVGTMLLGILYIGYGFNSIASSRIENGLLWTITILIIIWATDSGAYFIGKKFGKRKLIEKVSPNKTVEGFLGGILVALTFAVTIQFFLQPFENYLQLIVLSVVISISGQLGDLIESAMKRNFGVKDSGNIFPGHGGVLDRTDSWIFVFIGLNVLGMF